MITIEMDSKYKKYAEKMKSIGNGEVEVVYERGWSSNEKSDFKGMFLLTGQEITSITVILGLMVRIIEIILIFKEIEKKEKKEKNKGGMTITYKDITIENVSARDVGKILTMLLKHDRKITIELKKIEKKVNKYENKFN